jgi:predicted hydrocarbon binding protein/KaiC/GvpD/RAD55 family RecA-like ATPase
MEDSPTAVRFYSAVKRGVEKMDERGASLADIQTVPRNCLILLSGPPGSGKSTFCHQVVLNVLALERPVILVTTEHGPAEVTDLLRDKGMGEPLPGALSFVDAFGETVGATAPGRPDTVAANCEDLNSITMAIAKLELRMGRGDILLAFDSLTSPYLFNQAEMFRFVRLCLTKFASEGNSVLALMDEGCGEEQDLVAMMSVADGILRMAAKERSRTLNVVKHPTVEPAVIEVPIEPKEPQFRPPMDWDPDVLAQFLQSYNAGKTTLRRECGDFVNLFWPSLVHWSCMLWDPKGFPPMLYALNKYESSCARESIPAWPWSYRLAFKALFSLQSLGLYVPKRLSTPKDMKKMVRSPAFVSVENERSGLVEYLDDLSKTDEHHFRVYENSDCVGFEDIGVPMASHVPPMLAGFCEMYEKDGREWNAVETKCLGLGDPYCELKLATGEFDQLNASLEMESAVIEGIHGRLMDRLMGFLLDDKPLVDRPRLGSDVHLHVVMHGMAFLNLAGERFRRAQMMGAARSAKLIAERLMGVGLSEDQALERVLGLLDYCKVGKVTLGKTVRIRENCECFRTTILVHGGEPSCFFTTGFLNGLFAAVKHQHVREIKCIAAGDPYCEWEIL